MRQNKRKINIETTKARIEGRKEARVMAKETAKGFCEEKRNSSSTAAKPT